MQYAILMDNNWKFVLFDHIIIYIYIDALADQCYLIQTWRVFQNIVDNIIVDQDQLTCLLLRDLLNLKNRLNRQVQTLHCICMVYVWPMNNLFKYMTRIFIDHHLDFRHYYTHYFGFAVCIFIFFMSNFMTQL